MSYDQNERPRWWTGKTRDILSARDRLGKSQDRRKGTQLDTKEAPRRDRNFSQKNEGQNPLNQ